MTTKKVDYQLLLQAIMVWGMMSALIIFFTYMTERNVTRVYYACSSIAVFIMIAAKFDKSDLIYKGLFVLTVFLSPVYISTGVLISILPPSWRLWGALLCVGITIVILRLPFANPALSHQINEIMYLRERSYLVKRITIISLLLTVLLRFINNNYWGYFITTSGRYQIAPELIATFGVVLSYSGLFIVGYGYVTNIWKPYWEDIHDS